MGVSKQFRAAVKLADLRAYKIAQLADVNPSALSRIINGIDEVSPGDPRVIRVAEVLGLKPEECFESDGDGNGLN